jgi:hypothetical protein
VGAASAYELIDLDDRHKDREHNAEHHGAHDEDKNRLK